MDEFMRTRMGQKYFEQTLPELVEELRKLNENLEKLIGAIERKPHEEPEGE
jgi:hypothetical protein